MGRTIRRIILDLSKNKQNTEMHDIKYIDTLSEADAISESQSHKDTIYFASDTRNMIIDGQIMYGICAIQSGCNTIPCKLINLIASAGLEINFICENVVISDDTEKITMGDITIIKNGNITYDTTLPEHDSSNGIKASQIINDVGFITINDTNYPITHTDDSVLDAQANICYVFDNQVNELTINLPDVVNPDRLNSMIIILTTGSSPNISINGGSIDVSYYEGYEIDTNTSYELNILFDGNKWIIAYGIIE